MRPFSCRVPLLLPRRLLGCAFHKVPLPPQLRAWPWPLGSCRGAKILRWECDTPLAREMSEITDANDFLMFCLERADDFSRRDWLASLTLLTMRRRFSTALPLFQRYNARLLQDVDTHFEENLHLIMHRYGVLNYAPAIWRLLPFFNARLSLMNPKQVTLSAWALGRTLVNDEDTWDAMGDFLKVRAEEFSLADLAMYAWAVASVERCQPAEVVTLKKAARDKLTGCDVEAMPSHDLCMLFKAIARLTPDDRRFHGWVLLLMAEGMASQTMAFTAQGMITIWGTLAHLRWLPDQEILESLCEESRQLRLDHTFNQDMAAELAKALVTLGVEDARPSYQVVDYVARKGLSLRADTLLTLTQFLAARGVSHEQAWKKIGVRVQQRAVDLRLADIDRLVTAIRAAGKGNQRVYGMLELFARIREDHAKYGAA